MCMHRNTSTIRENWLIIQMPHWDNPLIDQRLIESLTVNGNAKTPFCFDYGGISPTEHPSLVSHATGYIPKLFTYLPGPRIPWPGPSSTALSPIASPTHPRCHSPLPSVSWAYHANSLWRPWLRLLPLSRAAFPASLLVSCLPRQFLLLRWSKLWTSLLRNLLWPPS